MLGQKTAYAIALLNFFNLTAAHGDDFYDALKAKNKYDSKTINDIRKTTVEDPRAQHVNEETKANPLFKPLSKGGGPMSEAEFRKLKAAEKNMTPDENDALPTGMVAGADKTTTLDTKTDEPSKKTPRIAKPESDGPPIKVTTDDPDEVTFDGEKPTPPKPVKNAPPSSKSAPTPIKKSK